MKSIFIIFFFIANISIFTNGMCQQYDPDKAIAYAEKWWNSFNNTPEDGGPYIDYTTYGGDCAAFVSQCLIAGSLDLSKGTGGNHAW